MSKPTKFEIGAILLSIAILIGIASGFMQVGQQPGVTGSGPVVANGDGTIFASAPAASGALVLNNQAAHTVFANSSGGSTTPSFTNNLTVNNMAVTGHYNQGGAGDMANKCSMVAATTCTFSINTTYTNYLCFASVDAASVGSITSTAIQVGCSLSGTTVTITAGASNSLTWDAILWGNPA